jgi:hypothetical protein
MTPMQKMEEAMTAPPNGHIDGHKMKPILQSTIKDGHNVHFQLGRNHPNFFQLTMNKGRSIDFFG